MPAALVRPVADAMIGLLGGPGKAVVCGSLRRGCALVGDVDVVLLDPDGRDDALARLSLAGVVHEQHDRPRDRLRIPVPWRIDGLELDLWTPMPGLVGACMMHATGPGPHNVVMRRWGLTRGLIATWSGVHRCSDGSLLGGRTEEETCSLIDWPHATPEHRERWREWAGPYLDIMNGTGESDGQTS